MDDGVVKLNVGGHIFTTTIGIVSKKPKCVNCMIDTLTAKIYTDAQDHPHFLQALFQGKHTVCKDKENTVFIDRDGTHFRYILNYLRAAGDFSKCYLPLSNEQTVRELEIEASFYSLTQLAVYLRGEHPNIATPQIWTFDSLFCWSDVTLTNENLSAKLSKPHIGATVRVSTPVTTNTHCSISVANARQASLLNYMEVRIDETEKKWVILGMVSESTKLDKLIGHDSSGYGFSIATGDTYNAHNYRHYGDKCQKGDQIGLWYDALNDSLYFFKNGKCMGCGFQNVIANNKNKGGMYQKWYFAVALCSPLDQVTIRPGAQRPAMSNAFPNVSDGRNAPDG